MPIVEIADVISRCTRCVGQRLGLENPEVDPRDRKLALDWGMMADAVGRPRTAWVVPALYEPVPDVNFASKAKVESSKNGFEVFLIQPIDPRNDAIWSARAICMLESSVRIGSRIHKGTVVVYWGQRPKRFAKHFSEAGRIIMQDEGFSDQTQERPIQQSMDPAVNLLLEDIEIASRRAALRVLFRNHNHLTIGQIIDNTPGQDSLHEYMKSSTLMDLAMMGAGLNDHRIPREIHDDEIDSDEDPDHDIEDEDDNDGVDATANVPLNIHDLDPEQRKLLEALEEYEELGATIRQLSEDVSLIQSNVRKIVHDLADKGFVTTKGERSSRDCMYVHFEWQIQDGDGDDEIDP